MKARGRRVHRDDYLELVIAFPLKAIRNDTQLAQAIEVIDRLVFLRINSAGGRRTTSGL